MNYKRIGTYRGRAVMMPITNPPSKTNFKSPSIESVENLTKVTKELTEKLKVEK